MSDDPMATVVALATENARLATREAALVGENAQQATQVAALATENAQQASQLAALATENAQQATQIAALAGESSRRATPPASPTVSTQAEPWQWASAGVMTTARSFHTATLLPDGRVLLAAGRSGSHPDVSLSSTEIYDPVSGTFRTTTSLNTVRHQHSATLLPDGRVLVIAGYNPSQGWLSSAEIHDPATRQWSVTQPIFVHGVTHTATLLKDGRVLVMAGAIRSGSAGPDDRVEIFDPKTNRWQPAARHENTEGNHTATLLPDGRVLIAGGSADPAIYDPASDTWLPTGRLAVERCSARAVLLKDGRVLLIGGLVLPEGGTALNSVEIYDPASNTWRQAAPLAQARFAHTATLLPDGRVLVTGGARLWDDPGAILNSVEIYDPVSDAWSALPSLQQARADHTATLLPDGRIFVAGGFSPEGTHLDSTEILEPPDRWSAGSMTVARTLHTATLLPDGRVLLLGGYTQRDVDTALAEVYDPATGMYQSIESLNGARHGHTTTLLPDGRLLVIAGYHDGWLSSGEIYDPATTQWTVTQPIFSHGTNHSATLLQDGRVLVMAGSPQSGGSPTPDDRVEIFDPRTNRWQQAAPHEYTGGSHTATLLTDGRLLIAGGNADPAIYDPPSDTWQPAGRLTANRWEPQAVRLQDGRVLLIGGRSPSEEMTIDSVEIYDPASNTWRQAAPLAQARYLHTTTLLPDGRVLVTGGGRLLDDSFDDPGAILNSVEIYDPATDTWSALLPLQQARADHTATLLPDGRIFVAGGYTAHYAILDSTEILELAGP